jgi:hypothetical protein
LVEDPEDNWTSFVDAIESLVLGEPEVHCVRCMMLKPWIDIECLRNFPSSMSIDEFQIAANFSSRSRSVETLDIQAGKLSDIAIGRRHSHAVGTVIQPQHPSVPTAGARRPSLFKKQSAAMTADIQGFTESSEDWEEKYDKKSDRRYWKNKVTGKTQWKNPFTGEVEKTKASNRHSVSFPLYGGALNFEDVALAVPSALKHPERSQGDTGSRKSVTFPDKLVISDDDIDNS